MTSTLIGILFVLYLAMAIALVLIWRGGRQALSRQDAKLAESLDDLDLVEFQENATQLIEALRQAGEGLSQQAQSRGAELTAAGESLAQRSGELLRSTERSIKESAASLDKLIERSKELERRIDQRLKQAEKQLDRLDKLYAKVEAKIPAKVEKEAKAARAKESRPAKAPAEPAAPPVAVLLPEPAAPQEAQGEAPPAGEGKAARWEHVAALALQGLSVEQIARQAHLLPGEVELILRLKRKG